MKRFFLFVTMLSLAGLSRADDQTQAVQQALKDQGFYYGQVDGQGGPETDAAIRRYQIRQGLDVTGKLDAQTLASLNLGAKSDPAAGNTLEAVPPPPSGDTADAQPADAQPTEAQPQATQPPAAVVRSDQDFLRQQPQPAAPAPAPDDETAAPQPPPPRERVAVAVRTPLAEYARFFRNTPYETAPPVVQRGTVVRVQNRLLRLGILDGASDGQISDALSQGLLAYQRSRDLPTSGRPDMATLADMQLLPIRQAVKLPPPPVAYGAPVYRGVWVH